jgi:hypothetical protein
MLNDIIPIISGNYLIELFIYVDIVIQTIVLISTLSSLSSCPDGNARTPVLCLSFSVFLRGLILDHRNQEPRLLAEGQQNEFSTK